MPMLRHAALAILAVVSAAPLAAQPRYSVTIVGGLSPVAPSGPVSLPLALNNSARVVGYAFTDVGQIRALNWRNGAAMPLGGVSAFHRTFANRVNSLGRIAGAGYILDANSQIVESHALKWTGGVMSDLGGFGGHHAAALAINDLDQIVGFATLPGETATRAFYYSCGVMTALRTLPGEVEAYAYDISNSGLVVGAAVTSEPAHPFLWRGGGAMELPIPSTARTGAANAVNDAGLVVGTYEINQYTGEFAAVRWVAGEMSNLGNLGGPSDYAVASDVNTAGQIVGTSNSSAGFTGYLWQGGRMYDLRALLLPPYAGLAIISATSITDRGQIAAAALVAGRQTAVILTPALPID
jgi:probable HAF family extracellular repeat protein